MAEIISRHTGQDVDQVLRDIDRDRFMTPEEAVEYGLVDAIMEPRGAVSGSVSATRGGSAAST
jgi:ATP-dependent Clp protease protease subunit